MGACGIGNGDRGFRAYGKSGHAENPHYLALDVRMRGKNAGIRNRGYHNGIVFEAGKSYRFSCWAKREQDRKAPLSVSLRDENDNVLDQKEFTLSKRLGEIRGGLYAKKRGQRQGA